MRVSSQHSSLQGVLARRKGSISLSSRLSNRAVEDRVVASLEFQVLVAGFQLIVSRKDLSFRIELLSHSRLP